MMLFLSMKDSFSINLMILFLNIFCFWNLWGRFWLFLRWIWMISFTSTVLFLLILWFYESRGIESNGVFVSIYKPESSLKVLKIIHFWFEFNNKICAKLSFNFALSVSIVNHFYQGLWKEKRERHSKSIILISILFVKKSQFFQRQ